MNTADAENAAPGQVLDALKAELERRAPMKPLPNDPSQSSRGEVNIMGDKNIPTAFSRR